jgi:hypothetical protein
LRFHLIKRLLNDWMIVQNCSVGLDSYKVAQLIDRAGFNVWLSFGPTKKILFELIALVSYALAAGLIEVLDCSLCNILARAALRWSIDKLSNIAS